MPTRPTARLVCSFCGKAYHQVRKLIAGPTLYVCDECIKLCNAILAEEKTKKVAVEAEPDPKKEVKAGTPPRCCSFCGKEQREVTALIAGQSDCICDECIGLCNDIIREEIEAIEAADTLKARVPEDIRALIAGIVEQALPAVEGAREVLDRRIREDTRPPDRLIWTASGLASDWERLHKILKMATPDESTRPDDDLASRSLGSPEGQVMELPGWVGPIAERLRGTSEVLGVLARRIEEPGLEEVLRPSLHLAREKLDEARELLLAGPPKPPLD